jgi:hypothetical protein
MTILTEFLRLFDRVSFLIGGICAMICIAGFAWSLIGGRVSIQKMRDGNYWWSRWF